MLVSNSPSRRAWLRFRRNRLGFYSLVVFCLLVLISLFAEVLSNDKPLIVHYKDGYYFPLVKDYPETLFGGNFETPTDYLDPFIQDKFSKNGNWAIYPINRYGAQTLNYISPAPNPAVPSSDNWLGTDEKGRDLLAQLIYGFRVSVLFALALTVIGVVL
ncbi:MAG: ABC transporter permease, partial [Burkholderiaceae bacterium]